MMILPSRGFSFTPKASQASTTHHASSITDVGVISIRHYFEVGNPVERSAGHFVGRDGRLVSGDSDLSRIRTFPTLRAANQFFDMMNGRYCGRPLYLRSNVRKLAPGI
jgi:hypothetical protein